MSDTITIERPAGAEVKAWGWTEPLWEQTEIQADGTVRVIARGVRVFIQQGGYSSIHLHDGCTNIFSVNQGRLRLRKFKKSDPKQPLVEWVQEPCDHPASMYPGDPHQFVALTDVLALEVYIASVGGDASVCNITRFSENGVLK